MDLPNPYFITIKNSVLQNNILLINIYLYLSRMFEFRSFVNPRGLQLMAIGGLYK